jgi:hypothetical protein
MRLSRSMQEEPLIAPVYPTDVRESRVDRMADLQVINRSRGCDDDLTSLRSRCRPPQKLGDDTAGAG